MVRIYSTPSEHICGCKIRPVDQKDYCSAHRPEPEPMVPIPIRAAKEIAERYGYDQVVIVARRVSETDSEVGGEHVTTYGVNKAHCKVAAQIGDFLKYKVMGWKKEVESKTEG